jgi:hypothetical protein
MTFVDPICGLANGTTVLLPSPALGEGGEQPKSTVL